MTSSLWDPPPWNTTEKLGLELVHSRVRAMLEMAQAAATHLGRQMSVCLGRDQRPSVNALHLRGEAALRPGPLNTTCPQELLCPRRCWDQKPH